LENDLRVANGKGYFRLLSREFRVVGVNLRSPTLSVADNADTFIVVDIDFSQWGTSTSEMDQRT